MTTLDLLIGKSVAARALLVTVAAVLMSLLFAPLVYADPIQPHDPSDPGCYRGSLTCFPPYYSDGNKPTCIYLGGEWVTPFGVPCSAGE